jgi:hypothetical protein
MLIPAGSFPTFALDVNGDGKLDLLNRAAPSWLEVRLGDGAGAFGAPYNYFIGATEYFVFGDLNGDGKPEMLTRSFSDPTLTVWINDIFGQFVSQAPIANTGKVAAVADFNGDGKGDLVSVGPDGGFTIRNGNGAGDFSAPMPYLGPGYSFGSVFVGDFNGDGRPDIAANSVYDFPTASVLYLFIYLNDGTGHFVSAGSYQASGMEPAAAVDLNHDGLTDVVGFDGHNDTLTALIRNRGGLGFARYTYPTKPHPLAVSTGDFDGDGTIDLFVKYDYVMYTSIPGESIFFGYGGGGFTRADYAKSDLRGLMADFNNDGKTDFLVATSNTWTGQTVVNLRQPTCAGTGTPGKIDYDGDGMTEFAVYRPGDGTWLNRARPSTPIASVTLGTAGDVPVPGDYDGDGKTDQAIFRPSNGTWYILRSLDNSLRSVPFGTSGDKPVTGDYDGDGTSDLAVFRPTGGVWYSLQSSDNSFHANQFGISSDVPVPADFDGDRKTDLAVFRPAGGVWYVLNSATAALTAQPWGADADRAVPADYDGDGRADIAVFRPAEGAWYALRSSNGLSLGMNWGQAGDIPVPGFDPDSGLSVPMVYRPSTASFYVSSYPYFATIGSPGDVPVSSP